MIDKSEIIKAVGKAKNQLKGFLVDFVFKKRIGNKYISGKNTLVFSDNINLVGIYEEFKPYEIDGVIVLATDAKILLFLDNTDIEPSVGDVITQGKKQFNVLRSSFTYIGDTPVLCTVTVRLWV